MDSVDPTTAFREDFKKLVLYINHEFLASSLAVENYMRCVQSKCYMFRAAKLAEFAWE